MNEVSSKQQAASRNSNPAPASCLLPTRSRGFALLIAVIFMSVMLSLGLALSSLGYKQQILASAAVESQYAFYAADAGLECALSADQQQNLFSYASHSVSNPPNAITCDNAQGTALNYSYDATQLVFSERLSLDSNTHCADVTVYKPAAAGATYLFSQGYDVSCVTVASPSGARFVSRGISTNYTSATSGSGSSCGSGGAVTQIGNDCINTFTSSGTFVPPSGVNSVNYLVVAGGGGGGGGSDGAGWGGGSGGGFRTGALSITSGNKTVTVGTGGAGGAPTVRSYDGGDSTFDTITASGGGGGASFVSESGTYAARNGGSGGGGETGGSVSHGTGNIGGYTPSEGSDGGNPADWSGGGGGGAGAVGGNASGIRTGGNAGNGGAGVASSISGSSATYAGGGGAGRYTTNGSGSSGTGGSGGGGNGGAVPAAIGANGTANTGGGGGGASGNGLGAAYNGGNGGSGIVIIRYTKP